MSPVDPIRTRRNARRPAARAALSGLVAALWIASAPGAGAETTAGTARAADRGTKGTSSTAATAVPLRCPAGTVRASGGPDPMLFAPQASRGIRAEWCERYGPSGRSEGIGRYLERHPSGRVRAAAHYVEGRLAGAVSAYTDDGRLFLRGFLEAGDWNGAFTLFHPNGRAWLEARFEAGRLHGPVRTRHPDGRLASESHYQQGREDGLARNFYPAALGGGLRSEVRVEADEFIGTHRRFGRFVRGSTRPATAKPGAAATRPAAPRPGAATRPGAQPSGRGSTRPAAPRP